MILALVPNSSSVETLLNNLSEADFKLSDVSVILSDQKLQKAIADDAGPLKGVAPTSLAAKLIQDGVSKADAATYSNGVLQGKALIAMTPSKESQAAAIEMLKDASAELIKVVP